ncbi:hypothetical protein FACS189472_16530 [Alphaproteobacteria bacterium]|nr:hypothetical protein FACS189472_16530 [Alphaproteobacteria bacterium]
MDMELTREKQIKCIEELMEESENTLDVYLRLKFREYVKIHVNGCSCTPPNFAFLCRNDLRYQGLKNKVTDLRQFLHKYNNSN